MRRLTPSPGSPPLSTLAEALAVAAAPATAAAVASDGREAIRRERDTLFADARRDGAAKGLADADAEIARRTDAMAAKLHAEHAAALAVVQRREKALQELAATLADAIARHRRESEEATVEAAFAALLQVLGDKAAERSLMPTLCAQILRNRGAGALTLRLAPADCALLDPAEDVRLVPDPALSGGQCVVESARGGSDTGLDVRLEAMKNAFLEGLSLHRGQS